MCGIAGIVTFGGATPEKSKLQLACDIMKLRGPDAHGFLVQENVGLAHRRLSIVDLSEAANQPMISADKKLTIVFNGEIYNFFEIRAQLIQEGFQFTTISDTETILAAYRFFGVPKMLQLFQGMFAFAIHDLEKKQVILARDRFGKKPLYMARDSSGFYFCSDIRFVASCLKQKSINFEAMSYFFHEMGTPQPQTIWNEINQLQPGFFMTLNLESNQLNTERYHRFEVQRSNETTGQVIERTEQLLIDAVKKRLVADVPVACFLSGGIDSGLIVSMLASHSNMQVNTFSVGYDDDTFQELHYARELSRKYGTNHQEVILKPQISEQIPEVLSNMGEPFADSSLIPTYLITKAMAGSYKVALSGDGGDELFGYPEYHYIYQVDQFLLKHPNAFTRRMKILSSRLGAKLMGAENFGHVTKIEERLNAEGHLLSRDMAFSGAALGSLSSRLSAQHYHNYLKRIWLDSTKQSITDGLILGSFQSRLLNDYLVKVDRSSMMNGVEVRSPFLDVNLAEYALTIPQQILFAGNTTKSVLKSLAKKYIDPQIEKRKKHGFGIPVGNWLRNDLKTYAFDLLSETELTKHNYFKKEYVFKLLDEHMNQGINHTHRLWTLICFQQWYRLYGS